MNALIVKEDGLIYVNEVPEEPVKSDYEEYDDYSYATRHYNLVMNTSAKNSAILVEDQEKAKQIAFNIDNKGELTPGWILQEGIYPIPDLKWEVKMVMSDGWQPTYNNPDNSGCEQPAEPIEVAILLNQ